MVVGRPREESRARGEAKGHGECAPARSREAAPGVQVFAKLHLVGSSSLRGGRYRANRVTTLLGTVLKLLDIPRQEGANCIAASRAESARLVMRRSACVLPDSCRPRSDPTTARMRGAAVEQLRTSGAAELRASWQLDAFFDRTFVVNMRSRCLCLLSVRVGLAPSS